jgi:hypothetical protein
MFAIAEDEPVSFGSDGILSGILAPLRNLSFWKMKDCARRFGENGGFRLLQGLQRAASGDVRLHLIGHSFGSIVAGRKVSGPILTTQSAFDFAVGRFYPLGAGVARQVSYAPKAPRRCGAVGEFGAHGPGIESCEMEMLPTSGAYAFEPDKLHNLESSKFICDVSIGASGAHSDIAEPEVTHAVILTRVHECFHRDRGATDRGNTTSRCACRP